MSLCTVHDAVVVFVEHGVGMCYGCVRELKAALERQADADAAAIAERLAAYIGSPATDSEARHSTQHGAMLVDGCRFCEERRP